MYTHDVVHKWQPSRRLYRLIKKHNVVKPLVSFGPASPSEIVERRLIPLYGSTQARRIAKMVARRFGHLSLEELTHLVINKPEEVRIQRGVGALYFERLRGVLVDWNVQCSD